MRGWVQSLPLPGGSYGQVLFNSCDGQFGIIGQLFVRENNFTRYNMMFILSYGFYFMMDILKIISDKA